MWQWLKQNGNVSETGRGSSCVPEWPIPQLYLCGDVHLGVNVYLCGDVWQPEFKRWLYTVNVWMYTWVSVEKCTCPEMCTGPEMFTYGEDCTVRRYLPLEMCYNMHWVKVLRSAPVWRCLSTVWRGLPVWRCLPMEISTYGDVYLRRCVIMCAWVRVWEAYLSGNETST